MSSTTSSNAVAQAAGSRAETLLSVAAVALAGAAVMVVELLGTRVIGPWFGVSLYVWATLIGVTMAALALGYLAGGWCADRVPRMALGDLLCASALAIAVIPVASTPVLIAADRLGLRAGALTAASVLFLPALAALGMVGPLAIKRQAHDLARIGMIAGRVYALSTLGSIAATFGTGFYLLPAFGTRAILCGTACVLALWSALLASSHRDWRRALSALGVTIIGAASCTHEPTAPAGFTVRESSESLYGWVRVVDDEARAIRLLLSDASVLSATPLRAGGTALAYQQLLYALPFVRLPAAPDRPRRALVIGLGGGHVATWLDRHGFVTDGIEIDPAVAAAARRDFGYRPQGRFIVGDARRELRLLNERYDVIVHDCFTGGAEPTYLLTSEMLTSIRAHLVPGGVLALNFVGFAAGPDSAAVRAVAATLASILPTQRVFVTAPDSDFTDFVFLAGTAPIEFVADDPTGRAVIEGVQRYEHLPLPRDGLVLRDDYNPLDTLQPRKAARYREVFRERVAPALLLR